MSGLSQDASFFDFTNEQANIQRNKTAEAAFRDVKSFLLESKESDKNLRIAIFDATNTTRERRRYLMECVKDTDIEMIFVESICNDKQILESNYTMKLKSPDYVGMDPIKAREDFEKRVSEYEKIYETLDEKHEGDLSYIKLFDVGLHMVLNRMHGYCAMEIVTYLGNIHINRRRIYLLRHGESENDVKQILSGDCRLTHKGRIFAHQVRDYLKEFTDPTKPLLVFSSTLTAATHTMERLRELKNTQLIETHVLDELGGGVCQGMTYEEIKKKFKEEFEDRQRDKLIFRYPGAGGESYLDLIERLKPMILEIERTRKDVVIISHNAVLRVILGYFLGTPIKEIPFLPFPKDAIIQLTTSPYGCDYHCVEIDMSKEAEISSSASNTPTPKSANSPDKF